MPRSGTAAGNPIRGWKTPGWVARQGEPPGTGAGSALSGSTELAKVLSKGPAKGLSRAMDAQILPTAAHSASGGRGGQGEWREPGASRPHARGSVGTRRPCWSVARVGRGLRRDTPPSSVEALSRTATWVGPGDWLDRLTTPWDRHWRRRRRGRFEVGPVARPREQARSGGPMLQPASPSFSPLVSEL
jgi:hypothetical protein